MLTESLCTAVLKTRESGEEINVIVYPGAVVAILEDGATPEEVERVLRSTSKEG